MKCFGNGVSGSKEYSAATFTVLPIMSDCNQLLS